MILNSTRLGSPDAPHTIVFLHGILGSGSNWRSFGHLLLEQLPDWQVFLVDLRNHGESSGANSPHTLTACVHDLVDTFASAHLRPTAVCGHSFGGKVALMVGAALSPGGSLRSVHSLDSPPGAKNADMAITNDVDRVLAAFDRIPLPVPRRDVAITQLQEHGLSEKVSRWIATNLTKAPDGYRWRFSLPGIREMLENFRTTDCWPLLETSGVVTHIVRAEKSQLWSDADKLRLDSLAKMGRIVLDVLPDADHWLHVDNPQGLVSNLVSVLGKSQ